MLAGGAGRRIGGAKGALRWRGRTLAEHAALALVPLCSAVRVSVAPDAPSPAPAFERVEDTPPPGRGPLAGIAAGFEACEGDLLVLACDYPLVDTALLRALLASAGPAPVVTLPVDPSGRDHPLVALWRRPARVAVEAALTDGRFAVHGVLEALAVRRLSGAELPGFDLGRVLANVNTAAELAALE